MSVLCANGCHADANGCPHDAPELHGAGLGCHGGTAPPSAIRIVLN